MTISGWVDTSLRPVDAVRRELLRTTWRLPWLGRLFQRSETRVPILASISVVTTFIVASVAPGLLFVLGPALLGVVHVASDVRYLVLRRELPRRWIMAVLLSCAALLALRTVELVAPVALPYARIEVSLGWGFALLGAWMGTSAANDRGRAKRAALVTFVLGGLLLLGVMHPLQARALLAYGHNVVALVIWYVLFRSRRALAWLPLALAGVASVVLIRGTTLPWLRIDGPWALPFIDEALAVSRRLSDRTALGLGTSYVFLQALHYAAWLIWIPQEDARSSGSLTFRMSARAARKDFGVVGLILISVLAAMVLAMSFFAVHRTRALYLSLATFHGYLEIASLAFLVMRAGSNRALAIVAGGSR